MVNCIKNTMIKLSATFASLALLVTALNVNTACMYFTHQEKLPMNASKLRKF
ncbi:MAG: cyclic lactone autoinducer peptide [Oscillospiraceae bacterium]